MGREPERETQSIWLTPNCNDYRCKQYGYCVFRRQACLDYLDAEVAP